MTALTTAAARCVDDWQLSVHLPWDAHAPRLCRWAVVEAVREYGMPGLAGDGGLVASELMTNAFQHGRGPLGFRVAWYRVRGRLRVTVWDGGGGRAAVRRSGPGAEEEEGGRGLLLVAVLAAEWGQKETPGGGKSVWAELAR